jgi:hypothetical protein
MILIKSDVFPTQAQTDVLAENHINIEAAAK